jgi:RimJ/RimL family protein N-acetyltransferase
MAFPIRTERLVLRPMIESDAVALWERRNLAEVAAHQTWATPWPREWAEKLVAGVMAMDGPENDEWWMLTIADPATDEPMGDLAVRLGWEGRSVEIGYTLHPDHWGQGYAVEAAEALARHAFEVLGATRVFGMLHPDNRASAQVLERIGMLFEGHTRSSYWVGDEVSDDWIYGMTRDDWEAWCARPRHRPGEVRLVEVTGDLFDEVFSLRTHKSQESFVAPMAKSLSQALLSPTHPEYPATPWYRAIAADGVITGFVMLALPDAERPEPFLWRLLVDRMHQRRGIASKAMDLVEDEVASWGHDGLSTSWVPGRGSPEPFYLARGYEPTGEVDDGELVARKPL